MPSAGAIIVSNSFGMEMMAKLQQFFKRPLNFFISQQEKKQLPTSENVKVENLPDGLSDHVVQELVHKVLSGEGAWFLPKGHCASQPHLLALDERVVEIAKESGKSVVPVWVESPSAEIFNFTLEKTATWLNRRGGADDILALGDPIPPAELSLEKLRECLLDLGSEAFAAREDLQISLPAACVQGLKARGLSTVVTDAFLQNKSLNGFLLLGLALALSRRIGRTVSGPRIGIVLPPGIASITANLASLLCGKVPVNLNFTAGRKANEIAIRKSGLDTIITVPALQERFKDFPWTEKVLDIQEELKKLPKLKILLNALVGALLPTEFLASVYGFSKDGGDREAALLFSSGSTGEPKGIVLTHKNIVANVTQVRETLQFPTEQKLLGCLPTFHSFGFTVTVWYPLCGGPQVVTYSNPLETAKLAEIIHQHQIQLAVTTPTFLRGYLKKASREQLTSLWGIVTGAEKLPSELAEQFEEKFGVPIREGYGLTETTPVVSVNLKDPPGGSKLFPGQTLHKRGTVGRPIPGVAVSIRDPETGTPQPTNVTGMIWLKGANVFRGYLADAERSSEVLKDGWFRTGDLGRMDEDGFLVIEGRVSRFSKIGGEMVPHGTLEYALQRIFAQDKETPVFAVTGRSHPERGEELVVLTSIPLTNTAIGEALRKEGFPNLWIPKVVKIVEKIPILASGKLDLQEINNLATES